MRKYCGSVHTLNLQEKLSNEFELFAQHTLLEDGSRSTLSLDVEWTLSLIAFGELVTRAYRVPFRVGMLGWKLRYSENAF